MEKIIFIVVCAICGGALVIAQGMHGGNGRGGKRNGAGASGGNNVNAQSRGASQSRMSSLQTQLEESKKRLRENSKEQE